jgi:hypothetical protein
MVHAPRSPVTVTGSVKGSEYWALEFSADKQNASTVEFVAARQRLGGGGGLTRAERSRVGSRGGKWTAGSGGSGGSGGGGGSGDGLSISSRSVGRGSPDRSLAASGGDWSVNGGSSARSGGSGRRTVDSLTSVFRGRLDVPTSGYLAPPTTDSKQMANLWQTADAASGWQPMAIKINQTSPRCQF